MINTITNSTPLLNWRAVTSNTKTKTATTEPASTSSSSQIADLKEQVQELRALLTNQQTNPLAGLSAGMLPPSSTVGLNPFGQNAQAWPMAGMPQGVGLGTPFSPPQGVAVDPSISNGSVPTGPVLSPGSLLA